MLFLPAAAAICLLNLNISVGAIPTACAPQVLAGTIPARNNFWTSHLHVALLEGLVLLNKREPNLARPLPPNLLPLVLKSTPSVSKLSAIVSPSSLLHWRSSSSKKRHEAIILLFPSFATSVIDNFKIFFSISSFLYFPHHLLRPSLFFPMKSAVISSTKTLNFNEG